MTGETASPTQPSAAQLVELAAQFKAGRYLDAHTSCRDLAPLEAWQAPAALVLAGRFAAQWGNGTLSRRLHQRAYRLDPANIFAAYYHGLALWEKHGVFEALGFVRTRITALPPQPASREEAYFWLLYARLLGIYRDFTAADPIFDRMLAAYPDDPWIWVERADFLENQDLYPAALAAAESALRVQPWYRPAVQSQAHLLQLLERDPEAITLLRASLEPLQSGGVVQMLVGMLEENGRLDELPPLLDLAEKYLPQPDTAVRRWLSGRRCMAAHRRGDTAGALDWARRNGSKYFAILADKLAAATGPAGRVQLPVGFVRQHHMTCAPATLTALSHFWGVAADHFEIARLICYDGSHDHAERDWAETAGWVVREFRLTWEIACQLLDRGCPFAVVTVETESAHMQAVIGYDARLETLLVRDPYHRQFREWLAPNFFEGYAAHGPRALVMLPAGRAALLADLVLPDAALYDSFYRLRRALFRHARPAAETALQAMRAQADGHLLTLWAGYETAQYDGRQSECLDLVRRIRALHPDNPSWRLIELRLRERLGDQVEHRKFLHEAGAVRGALVTLRREYAEDLARDARQHGRARRLLRSLLRRQATEPKNLRAYANLLWNLREFAEALVIYRLAACQADKVEYHWNSFFIASRHLGQEDECLQLLRSRVARWGASSSLPARTLFESLNALDRTDEGFALLQEALRLRPDDGELLLFTAEAATRYGRYEEAGRLLEAAQGREARPQWLRSAARMADYRRDHAAALAHWRGLAALNPADTSAHSAIAHLLTVKEGAAAAIVHLQQACAERPQLLPLHQTLVQQLRDAPAEDALVAVDRMLSLDPADAWARREKALILRRLRRLDEALACADEAVRIAPHAPPSHGVRAEVLCDLGRLADAHAGYSTGIRLSIDADWLFSQLIAVCPDFAARKAAVAFLHGELLRQNSLEHACLQFRVTARAIVTTAELTAMLEAYHEADPEAWAGWSALTTHCLETGAHERALALARTATERFPLTPRAWTDLARVHARAGDTQAEIACIQKALAINPAWGQASRQLSIAYEHLLQLDQAAHVLSRAVAASPLEAANHGCLADILWRQRKPDEAFAAIETALALNPGYSWAWDRLGSWSQEQGDPGRARRLAKKFTESRAGEAGSWLRLVRLNFSEPDLAANLAALDRAAQLTPFDPDVWDLRAHLLAENLRYDEALAACRPEVFGPAPPYLLEGRAAWIENRRGRIDEAIVRMKAVVAAHPDYRWGWACLTEWHYDKKQFEEVGRTAEKWAWLEPEASTPHGYLATVHQKAGRRKEAKAALARALSLDPLYGFGATELLKMHLEDSEFTEARQVLKHFTTHYAPWESLRAEMRCHIAAKDRPAALETLRKLGRQPAAATDTLQVTVSLLLEAGWSEVVEASLEPLLADPAARPAVGELWIKARKKRSLVWATGWRLFRLRGTAAQQATALAGYVSWLAESRRPWLLRLAILVWRRRLREDPECWGSTGYALATVSLFRPTARWMHDWHTRPRPAAPWMLSNLLLALQSLGRTDEARRVLEHALALPPDHVHEKLLGWQACELALAGETAAATRRLDQINPSDKSKFHLALLQLARLLTELQNTPAAERPGTVRSIHARLRAEADANPQLIRDPALRHMYRRTLDRLGRDAGKSWLRVRSRLPLFAPAAAAERKSTPTNWWLIIAVWILISSLARSCS